MIRQPFSEKAQSVWQLQPVGRLKKALDDFICLFAPWRLEQAKVERYNAVSTRTCIGTELPKRKRKR
jgi:hypothetical protein